MPFKDIEPAVAALIATLAPREARWLAKLFRSQAAFEAFTALESELFVGKEGAYSGALMISSATRGEGRTTIAMLLAVMSSAYDKARRILLVDADGDGATLSRLFPSGEGRMGLREYFDGQAKAEECIAQTAIPNLWIAPMSRDGAGGVRLAPLAFKRFMEEARTRFDLVVVDSPAAGGNRAFLSLASIVGNVLVVIKYGGPTREQVATLKADLERTGAGVIGCILNQREFVVPRFLYGSR